MTDYYIENEDLSGSEWVGKLLGQPQFSTVCQWDKLNGYDWICLLRQQPQFAKQCRWKKLDQYDWTWLVDERPQLCNTEELQIMAISKSKKVFDLLRNPSERMRKLHEMKWVL
ncbi:MAG: hypothetical protein KAJ33_08800 [Thermoplasmata archaeon]|nr:hypothetical protein [Thermoplasmata archaeon]